MYKTISCKISTTSCNDIQHSVRTRALSMHRMKRKPATEYLHMDLFRKLNLSLVLCLVLLKGKLLFYYLF